MTHKDEWRQFSESEPTVPIFSRGWWLDTVCGVDGWDVAIVKTDGKIEAALPYQLKKVMGMHVSRMPGLTQTLGPWLVPSTGKYSTVLSREHDVIRKLIGLLPRFIWYEQRFNWRVFNWLPFYWSGFGQSTRYTYIINYRDDLNDVWADAVGRARSDIRKAEKAVHVAVDVDTADVLRMIDMTYLRQGAKRPFSEAFFLDIDRTCRAHSSVRNWCAKDDSERTHAAIYCVFDDRTVYYLASGADPALRSSGAMSLLIWEAIKFAQSTGRDFDFEGSMIEPIESFFRSFGAVQRPYFEIYKGPWFIRAALDAKRARARKHK